MIAIVLDRRRARFFDVSNGTAVELPGLRSSATEGGRYHSDRADSPGRGERAYHQRLAEEERRHYDHIANRLATLTAERPGDRLFIAGPGPAATAFQHALPQDLARLVVGSARLNPAHVTPAEVHAAARKATERRARDEQREVITAVEEGVGTGRATNGARETLRALAKGQVRTLVVRDDVRGSAITAAIEEATSQDAAVVILRDPEAARHVDGLAALLRFGE